MTVTNYPIWTTSNNHRTNNYSGLVKQNTQDIISMLEYLAGIMSHIYRSDIHPAQCDMSTSTIRDILVKIKTLYGYLEDSTIIDVADKYEVVVVISYLEEQLESLHSLILDLRPRCRENISRLFKMQKAIREQFEEILQTESSLISIHS